MSSQLENSISYNFLFFSNQLFKIIDPNRKISSYPEKSLKLSVKIDLTDVNIMYSRIKTQDKNMEFFNSHGISVLSDPISSPPGPCHSEPQTPVQNILLISKASFRLTYKFLFALCHGFKICEISTFTEGLRNCDFPSAVTPAASDFLLKKISEISKISQISAPFSEKDRKKILRDKFVVFFSAADFESHRKTVELASGKPLNFTDFRDKYDKGDVFDFTFIGENESNQKDDKNESGAGNNEKLWVLKNRFQWFGMNEIIREIVEVGDIRLEEFFEGNPTLRWFSSKKNIWNSIA